MKPEHEGMWVCLRRPPSASAGLLLPALAVYAIADCGPDLGLMVIEGSGFAGILPEGDRWIWLESLNDARRRTRPMGWRPERPDRPGLWVVRYGRMKVRELVRAHYAAVWIGSISVPGLEPVLSALTPLTQTGLRAEALTSAVNPLAQAEGLWREVALGGDHD